MVKEIMWVKVIMWFKDIIMSNFYLISYFFRSYYVVMLFCGVLQMRNAPLFIGDYLYKTMEDSQNHGRKTMGVHMLSLKQ